MDAAAALQHLALRRQAWLESAQQRDGRDATALVAVGDAIDAQLADVGPIAEFLRECFEEYAPWVDERLAAALASGRFGETELAGFAKAVPPVDGDYASRASAWRRRWPTASPTCAAGSASRSPGSRRASYWRSTATTRDAACSRCRPWAGS